MFGSTGIKNYPSGEETYPNMHDSIFKNTHISDVKTATLSLDFSLQLLLRKIQVPRLFPFCFDLNFVSGTVQLLVVTLALAAGLAQVVLALQAAGVHLAEDADFVVAAARRQKLLVRISLQLFLLFLRQSVR